MQYLSTREVKLRFVCLQRLIYIVYYSLCYKTAVLSQGNRAMRL